MAKSKSKNVINQLFGNFTNPFGNKNKNQNNAIKVGRGDRFAGEVAQDLPLFRYYEYYFGWPEAKDGINSIHARWMGIRQEIRSEDEDFQEMCKMWIAVTNFWTKLSQYSLDTLIGGAGIMELQFHNNMLANVSHIPTKSIWKIFRDRFGNVREYIQMIDGEFVILAPKYIMQYNINNPDEEALGHSELFSVATPQKVSGKRDEFGTIINADRYIPSVLDTNARLKFAHMETLEKHARTQIFVTIDSEEDRVRQEEIEKQLNDKNSDKWMHVTNKDVKVVSTDLTTQAPFKDYSDELERSVDRAVGFPGKVMSESGSMGFASSQTPVQEMANRIANKQNDLNNLVVDVIFKQLAEQWGFDFAKVRPEIIFVPFKEPMTFDQVMQLEPSSRISDKEFRDMLRHHVQDLNDTEFEEFQKVKDQRMLEASVNVDPRKSTSTDPENERPDIEDDAPKPPQTNSLEYFLSNPKRLENYIRGVISHERETSAIQFRTDDDDVFESPPPEVTDPKVLQRLKDLAKNLKSSKENLEHTGYAGFATLQNCIEANRQEGDPKGYCLIEFGKATEQKEAAQAELSDFMKSFKKASDLNQEMFGGDPHYQRLNEDFDVVNSTKSIENDEMSRIIKELKEEHPDWKQDQIIAVAIKKSKENTTSLIFPDITPAPTLDKKKKKQTSNAKSYEHLFSQQSGSDPIK